MLTEEICLKAHEELSGMLVATDYLDGRAVCTYPIMEDELGLFYKLIEEHFDPQPYKFEDLKPHMFVFDKDFNGWGEILRIVETSVNEYREKIVKCLATGDSSLQTRSYKENRFFPATKAMQYQNNK